MPLVKCIRRCWDSQLTRRYYPGDIADYPEDHVFLTGPIKCFQLVNPKEIAKSDEDPNTKISQIAEMVEGFAKHIGASIKPSELIPEEKRPIGRPKKE